MASPAVSPTGGWVGTALFLLLFAATLTVFSARVRKLIALLAKGRREQRADHLGERIGEIFLVVLAQKSVLRDPLPGTAHLLTFWTFIVTGLGGLDLVLAAFGLSLPLVGGNRAFTVLQDALIVLAVLALLLFALRRAVMRPRQLSSALHGPWDGYIILGLILATVVTLVPVEDFLYVASHRRMLFEPGGKRVRRGIWQEIDREMTL
jgi:hypothetical protein